MRRAAGLSQVALAELVGCNRIIILALERDLTGNISTLVRGTKVLGVRQLMQHIHVPKSKRLIPQTNAPERDVVLTPPDLAAVVNAHLRHRCGAGCWIRRRRRARFMMRCRAIWIGIGAR